MSIEYVLYYIHSFLGSRYFPFLNRMKQRASKLQKKTTKKPKTET